MRWNILAVLASLRFPKCNFSAEGVRAFAGPLRWGALKARLFGESRRGGRRCRCLGGDIAESNAHLLTEPQFEQSGNGRRKRCRIASVVQQGHFEELEDFYLAHNSDVTDEGMTVLARAIDASGLPLLETFTIHETSAENLKWTIGVRTLVYALSKRCPQLVKLVWSDEKADQDLVKGMLHAAGRGNVEVTSVLDEFANEMLPW